jgi:protoheme IX farnesyltransferase
MRVPADVSLSVESPSLWAQVADYVALTKPRLSGLVLFTTFGGMWMSGAKLQAVTWLCALVGTAGTVGAANAFNCFIEREVDRHMARTAVRPLPSLRMEPWRALVFAFALAVASLPVLFVGVNSLTGVLGAVALLSYVLVYTPLKSRTHWAMVAGAVPGALPPLMGWTAAAGRIEAPGLALFAILFLWQLPHFIAIALFRKAEYRAAGLTSLPLQKGDDVARRDAVAYTALLIPASLSPWWVGQVGWGYAVVAAVLGAGFLGMAVQGWVRHGDERWARRFFGASLAYLTGLFVALGVGGLLTS